MHGTRALWHDDPAWWRRRRDVDRRIDTRQPFLETRHLLHGHTINLDTGRAQEVGHIHALAVAALVVLVVDDARDVRVDDALGTIPTRRHRNVQRAARRETARVVDGVRLGVQRSHAVTFDHLAPDFGAIRLLARGSVV